MRSILGVSYPRKQSDDEIIALKISRGIHVRSRRMLNNIRAYEGYVRMRVYGYVNLSWVAYVPSRYYVEVNKLGPG